MANNAIPPPAAPPAPIPLPAAFLPQQDTRFADNEFQNITEKTFRDFAGDIDGTFIKAASLTTNMVRGSVFRVPYVNLAAGVPTVPTALIPPRLRILGMEVLATNGTDAATAQAGGRADPITFRLVADSAGTVVALVDELPTTILTIRARWVRTSGTDAQKMASIAVFQPEDFRYEVGDIFQFTFTNFTPTVTRLFEVLPGWVQQFQNPLPTGDDNDPYYKPFAPLSSSTGGNGGPPQTIDESNLMHLSGAETVTGPKDFTARLWVGDANVYTYLMPDGRARGRDQYAQSWEVQGNGITFGYSKLSVNGDTWTLSNVAHFLVPAATQPTAAVQLQQVQALVAGGYTDAQARAAQLNQVAGPGGTITFLKTQGYPVVNSGTHVLNPAGAVVGVVVTTEYNAPAGAGEPDWSDPIFKQAGEPWAPAKRNVVMYYVLPSGFIEYTNRAYV